MQKNLRFFLFCKMLVLSAQCQHCRNMCAWHLALSTTGWVLSAGVAGRCVLVLELSAKPPEIHISSYVDPFPQFSCDVNVRDWTQTILHLSSLKEYVDARWIWLGFQVSVGPHSSRKLGVKFSYIIPCLCVYLLLWILYVFKCSILSLECYKVREGSSTIRRLPIGLRVISLLV